MALVFFFLSCGKTEGPTSEHARREPFYSAQVQKVLDAASAVVETRGFAGEGAVSRGFLVARGTEVLEVRMQAGVCYVVLVAASSGLEELSVRVFDSEGASVATDTRLGPQAAVRFCPSQSSAYYVALQSLVGSGLYAVRRFRGPAGLKLGLGELFAGPEAATGASSSLGEGP